jgi:hypothetical protein
MDQRITMKTEGASVSPGVIRPDFLARRLVERKKFSGAGADKEEIATDRGPGKYSTSGLNLPHDLSR